jgi:type II secretory pathway component PulF
MPMFHYEASDPSGKILVGTMDARDEADLRARLAQRGLSVALVEASGSVRANQPKPSPAVPQRRAAPRVRAHAPRPTVVVSNRDLGEFYRQMATFLRSGVALLPALQSMRQAPRPAVLRAALADMEETVRAGHPVSEAMARHPRAFSPSHVGLVAAGESSGNMERSFDELATQAEMDFGLQRQFNLAILYQRWMLLPVLVSVGYVVVGAPRLSRAAESGAVGQAVASLLSQAFAFGVFVTLAVNVAIPLLFRAIRSTPAGSSLDAAVNSLPFVGDRVRREDRVRTLQSLASALDAGVPLNNAWQLATDTALSPLTRRRMEAQYTAIRSGTPVADAMAATGVFDSTTMQMAYTGEASGSLPEMLRRAAEIQRDTARYAARRNSAGIAFAVAVVFALVGGGIILMAGLRYASILGGLTDMGGGAQFIPPSVR